jgi:cytochrome c
VALRKRPQYVWLGRQCAAFRDRIEGEEMKTKASFSALLISAAALALAGCSGGETESEDTAATETAAPAANETAAAEPAVAAATTIAYSTLSGDAAKGEKVFIQCKTCHVVDPGQNRVGPSLAALIGRKAGTVEGFNYSPANKNSGKTWDEETLYTYLEAPQKFIPGTKMAFAGLKNPQDRADVIAYLKTKS